MRKSKLEQMDVLQNLPFFRVWTKTQLLKIVNFILEPKTFIKNQIVYQEGNVSNQIYIIRQGEFEVQKKYLPFDDYTYNPNKIAEACRKMFGQQQSTQYEYNRRFENPVKMMRQGEIDRKKEKGEIVLSRLQRNVEIFKLALLGQGQIFGDDDIFFNRPYSSTVICRSNTGIVIQMNGPELLKKMRGNEDCWKIFLSYIQQKESVKRKRLNKLDYVFHKEPLNLQDAIEEANKNLKAKNLEKQL